MMLKLPSPKFNPLHFSKNLNILIARFPVQYINVSIYYKNYGKDGSSPILLK